ncbi:hypothetical protein Dsin_016553 [Dipteronia sinensis]|uniref:Uncharacterized protein n=1 Tax=Dipteronia sinensis TaxID=43782 RepID=A0AAE0AEL7_9ROSI|nr:hypothetical protein Dsin_016553 [Dipteronia sinensis]
MKLNRILLSIMLKSKLWFAKKMKLNRIRRSKMLFSLHFCVKVTNTTSLMLNILPLTIVVCIPNSINIADIVIFDSGAEMTSESMLARIIEGLRIGSFIDWSLDLSILDRRILFNFIIFVNQSLDLGILDLRILFSFIFFVDQSLDLSILDHRILFSFIFFVNESLDLTGFDLTISFHLLSFSFRHLIFLCFHSSSHKQEKKNGNESRI